MKDPRALAYVNLYAILGSLSELCRLDKKAAMIVRNERTSIGIRVHDGPSGVLHFLNGTCHFEPGCGPCDILLPFSSPEKFNGMIQGTVKPIPVKGFLQIGFLLGPFTKLTDRLSKVLKPDPKVLANRADFFRLNTLITFYVVTEALSQLANEDPIGRASASYIPDGICRFSIGGSQAHTLGGQPTDLVACGIVSQDHRLRTVHAAPSSYTSMMRFANLKLANALFQGKTNAMNAIGTGMIRVGGMIPQVDNLNRILDRVSVYLA